MYDTLTHDDYRSEVLDSLLGERTRTCAAPLESRTDGRLDWIGVVVVVDVVRMKVGETQRWCEEEKRMRELWRGRNRDKWGLPIMITPFYTTIMGCVSYWASSLYD